jgi:hypothetical protein
MNKQAQQKASGHAVWGMMHLRIEPEAGVAAMAKAVPAACFA